MKRLMANGRGSDFRRSVRLMRTVISIHYSRRIAQVFFEKNQKNFVRCFLPHFGAQAPEQAGQACRSRPHKIPHKSPALPDFYTAARAAAARPRPPCGREGGITPGSGETGGVSRGDSVPPGHFNAPAASCHYPAPHRTPHGTARADPAHPACRASRPTGRARSFRARA